MNDILLSGDKLSLGVQLNLDYFYGRDKFPGLQFIRKDTGLSWKMGLLYKLNKRIAFGLYYRKGAEFEGKIKTEGGSGVTVIVPDSNFTLVQNEPRFSARIPDEFVFGVLVKPSEYLSLAFSLSSVAWKSINSTYNEPLELSLNSFWDLKEMFGLSFGFSYSDLNRESIFSNGDLHAGFINAGIMVSLEKMDIIAEIIDSHLFSAESRQQFFVRVALNYYID